MNVRMLPLKFCYYVLLTVAVAPVNILSQCENSPPRCRLRVQRASHAASSTVERW